MGTAVICRMRHQHQCRGTLNLIGSGSVIIAGLLTVLFVGLFLGYLSDWEATWRAFSVTPLKPHFFDTHAVTDHVECASKGFDSYVPTTCNRLPFNYPPIWLGLRYFGINGSDSVWLAIAMIGTAAGSLIWLSKGRSACAGLVTLAAMLSPSIMMGVERGNIDLLILALVGLAALSFGEPKSRRMAWTVALLQADVVLKLYPIFCVALLARPSRHAFIVVLSVVAMSAIYSAIIFDYIPIIRHNTPTTYVLSFGYLVPFLGLDHLRDEAGLSPIGLATTWLPLASITATSIVAALTAIHIARKDNARWNIPESRAGTAFLFGAGIYCGTFMLGSNFIYRLMFLLLCFPQIFDWSQAKERMLSIGLLALVILALWTSGNANGHTTFSFWPSVLHWVIYFGLITILMLNCLRNANVLSPQNWEVPSAFLSRFRG